MEETMLAYYEEKVRENPADTDLRAEYAGLLGVVGRTSGAAREFEICLQQDPQHGRALVGCGLFYCIQGNPRKGAKYLEKAVRHITAPADQISAVGLLGAAYHMSGDLPRAIARWETLLDPLMQPLIGFEAHLSLGIAYLQNGSTDRAIQELRVARRLAQDDSTLPRRFPGVALGLSRNQLSLWARDSEAQDLFDLIIPLAWGICRPEDVL